MQASARRARGPPIRARGAVPDSRVHGARALSVAPEAPFRTVGSESPGEPAARLPEFAPMELIPAIDLAGGRVVRLQRGDFHASTDYGADPVAVARRWVEEGAPRLHVVDLDGARTGKPTQSELMAAVCGSVPIPCQVAGGLRDARAVEVALRFANRVVLGTAILRQPQLARQLVEAHGSDRIVAALDVRDGAAVGDGWRRGGVSTDLEQTLGHLVAAGIRTFVVTAIARDGLLMGPDLALLDLVRRLAPRAAVIASGGVSTAEDVRVLARRGFAGAILGRALYEGKLTLADALAGATAGGPPATEAGRSPY